MTVYLPWCGPAFISFVKCLQSLQNLHTLEVGWAEDFPSILLDDALKGVDLPQIKTLIIPPTAHPLLRHCRDVEDLVYAIRCDTAQSHEFLRSLPSKRSSKVKRLAIPLTLWLDPSRKLFNAEISGWK